LAGAALLAAAPRVHGPGRALTAAGGALLLAGSVCKRWSVFKAGFQSAEEPLQTVVPQRRRVAEEGGGA
jgi:hypothetical protein